MNKKKGSVVGVQKLSSNRLLIHKGAISSGQLPILFERCKLRLCNAAIFQVPYNGDRKLSRVPHLFDRQKISSNQHRPLSLPSLYVCTSVPRRHSSTEQHFPTKAGMYQLNSGRTWGAFAEEATHGAVPSEHCQQETGPARCGSLPDRFFDAPSFSPGMRYSGG